MRRRHGHRVDLLPAVQLQAVGFIIRMMIAQMQGQPRIAPVQVQAVIVTVQVVVAGIFSHHLAHFPPGEKVYRAGPAVKESAIQIIFQQGSVVVAGILLTAAEKILVDTQVDPDPSHQHPGMIDGISGVKMIGFFQPVFLEMKIFTTTAAAFPPVVLIGNIQPLVKIPHHQQGPGPAMGKTGEKQQIPDDDRQQYPVQPLHVHDPI